MLTYEKFLENYDIIVTIPSTIKWEDYEKELIDAQQNNYVLNFKVNSFPKYTKKGNKCYLVHNNYMVGWLYVIGFEEKEFTCQTTGKKWKGKFILRSPKFNKIEPIYMKGFRGFRYLK